MSGPSGLSPMTGGFPGDRAAGVWGASDTGRRNLPFFEDPAHSELILAHADTGFLPLKYAYAGSAAFTHAALASTEGYHSVVGTAELEVGVLMEAARGAAPTQVAEIGPGTGEHTLAFLTLLQEAAAAERARGTAEFPLPPDDARQAGFRYLGLDFSSTLLTMARGCLATGLAVDGVPFGPFDVRTALWDVEQARTDRVGAWRRDSGPVLMCLLGHTLGNLGDPVGALRHLAASARPGDLLLVGLTLYPRDASPDAILAPYLNDVFTAAVLEPLRAADFGAEDVLFEVRRRGRAVVGDVTFARRVDKSGHTYRPGQRVQCFFSTRFLPNEGLEIVRQAGWTVQSYAIDQPAEHLAIVARL
ncbi:L-histidine N-alpha-methyltransferase [Catenulispora sp. GP43]|uniref:L-histidine N(alpha)-methyltransferase n=1 Tax=Catenulispora sp. GP43 TaxID=3156263 RepID=UPI00351614CA